jgi:prepilin peptidase CpaA
MDFTPSIAVNHIATFPCTTTRRNGYVTPAAGVALVAFACATVGALCDIASRRVPNLLTLPAILCGLLLHLLLAGARDLLFSLAAGALCGSLFFVLYLAGGMGAGDVKLMAAMGCLSGLPQVPMLLLATALAGGVMALALALRHGRLLHTLGGMRQIVAHHGTHGLVPHPELHLGNSRTLRLPYAVAIAFGSLVNPCLLLARNARP